LQISTLSLNLLVKILAVMADPKAVTVALTAHFFEQNGGLKVWTPIPSLSMAGQRTVI
jgi:hypothetical protein